MTHARTERLALATFAILAIGCMQGGGQARTQDARSAARMSDAEIAAVLDVANRGEIQQAELARERAEEDQVRGYATAMIAGHGAAARQQTQLLEERGIRPAESAMSQEMMDRGRQVEERLRGLEGAEFDRAYMEAQLQQHRDLLTMLDEELIPSAQDPQYRAFLEQLRGEVAAHLRNAERIRGEIVG